MAPPPIALTPEPADYFVVKTPRQDGAVSGNQDHLKSSPSQTWANKYWYLGSIAQLIAVASAALYVVAAVVYLTPYYWVIDPKLAIWWGAPTEEELEANPDAPPGHTEMTLPTYLFLGLFVPFLLGSAAVHVLRNFNVRRITSRYILSIAMVLRRKPFAFGRLSYFGYGELLFLVVFLFGGNVLVSWYQYDAYIGYISAGGRELTLDLYLGQIGLLLGYTCVWNMAFLFLPATRNCAWMEFLGISYANGIKYHRWAGVMVVVTGVGHTIPYYWMWVREGSWIAEALPCFNCAVDKKSEGSHVWFNVYGELALICFLVLAFASLPVVRRRLYETFYYVHHLFIPGVIFTVLHWPTTTWFIFPSFLVYLVDRAVSSSNAFWPVQVAEFTALPDGIIKVVISRSPHDDGSYCIGQFVYLNAPAISKLQWHPFTIASSPRTSATSLTILLKSLGDWTAALTEYAHECKSRSVLPTLFMDGYYGESLNKYQEYPTVCLVGGGIGVTPILAILEDLALKLLHGGAELDQRVFFIFTFRELTLLDELHPVMSALRELDPQEKFFTHKLFLTRVPEDEGLNQPIRSAKLQPKSHDQIGGKNPSSKLTTGNATPFAEPLRTPGVKIAMYGLIIVAAVCLVTWLEYGNGKIVDGGSKSQLWMVQDFVEISVLFVCTLVVYVVVVVERYAKQRGIANKRAPTEKEEHGVEAFASFAHGLGDIHTFRDLVAAYDVTIGRRPDMAELIRDVRDGHETRLSQTTSASQSGVVGVFVSGPEELKLATEYAIASAGAHHFDIHAEEFEL